MRRRDVIRRGALLLGVAGALGGCAERAGRDPGTPTPPKEHTPIQDELPDLPVEEQSDVLAERIAEASEADVADLEAFERALAERDVEVEHVGQEAEILELEQVATDRAESGVLPAVGTVAGAYAALVRGGHDVRELDGTILDADGREFGSYHVVTEWAEAYVAGERSAAEYGEEVASTLETE